MLPRRACAVGRRDAAWAAARVRARFGHLSAFAGRAASLTLVRARDLQAGGVAAVRPPAGSGGAERGQSARAPRLQLLVDLPPDRPLPQKPVLPRGRLCDRRRARRARLVEGGSELVELAGRRSGAVSLLRRLGALVLRLLPLLQAVLQAARAGGGRIVGRFLLAQWLRGAATSVRAAQQNPSRCRWQGARTPAAPQAGLVAARPPVQRGRAPPRAQRRAP
jgi:hypothetical protein